ncbi:MAG: hypothetical protein K9G49_11345 [Taibaiella sp.]|nr:hypothetical protein [Taibaiella sp.]
MPVGSFSVRISKLFTVFALLLFAKQVFGQQYTDSLMLWTPDKKITSRDFKHPVDSIAIKRGVPFKASSLLDIKMDVQQFNEDDTQFIYNIYPVFFRYLSWLYDTTQLPHEQLHFDISEVYARKMRRCIQLMKKEPDNYEWLKIKLNELYYDHAKYHVLYDKETHSGKFVNMQLLWNRNIATQLDTLKRYNLSGGTIKLTD